MTATVTLPAVFIGHPFNGDDLTKYANDLRQLGTLWERVEESGCDDGL
jgi:hypothetical protein